MALFPGMFSLNLFRVKDQFPKVYSWNHKISGVVLKNEIIGGIPTTVPAANKRVCIINRNSVLLVSVTTTNASGQFTLQGLGAEGQAFNIIVLALDDALGENAVILDNIERIGLGDPR